MKKKYWFITPQIITLLSLILLMTAVSFLTDRVQLISSSVMIAIVAVGLTVWRTNDINRDIHSALTEMIKYLEAEDEQSLNEFPLPAVAVSRDGEILCYNDKMRDEVLKEEDILGGYIFKVFSGFEMQELRKLNSKEVRRGDRRYNMFVKRISGNQPAKYVILFDDITVLRNTLDAYNASRPVVMYVIFDNREELSQLLKTGEVAKITVKVEDAVEKWGAESKCITRKLSSGKYIIVTEEKYLRGMIEKKFSILETVRRIMSDGRGTATLSIGVGHGAESLYECEKWASQALDMSLGRGGDQVSVKSPDGFIFFGGVSKTVEKHSKVRSRMLANSIAELISQSSNVLIMGHRYSDLDSIGSAVGMYSIAKSLGKRAHIVCDIESSMAGKAIERYISTADDEVFVKPAAALEIIDEYTLLIIVDSHNRNVLEAVRVYEECAQVIVIDHHRKVVGHIDNAVIFFHEPFASSASEMVTEIAQYINEKAITRAEAEALLGGIMLDTKSFVLRTGVRTFEAAAFLRRRGADTIEVKQLFSDSLDTYIEKSKLVSAAELYDGTAIACVENGFDNIRIVSSQAADELLTISGIMASYVIFPTEDYINISARSFGKVNVQIVMEKLGGGGHQTMAAVQLPDVSIKEAKEMLLKAIDDVNKSL